MFFPFPCGAMRTAAAPAWPVCDCVCVIALCQGQGRAAGPRLSGASAHLGKFRLNSSTFLNTQLIETLTNSNPRARPQMGREPRQHSEREGEGGSRDSHSTGVCYTFTINIYTSFFLFFFQEPTIPELLQKCLQALEQSCLTHTTAQCFPFILKIICSVSSLDS